MTNDPLADFRTVRLDDEAAEVVILDQTRLPEETVYVRLRTAEDMYEAIYRLRVRGAPAIGVTAAYGMYVCCRRAGSEADGFDGLLRMFRRTGEYLVSSRPTAVNLKAAVERMERCMLRCGELSRQELLERMRREAEAIRDEDAAACRRIGEYGLSLLRPGMGLLTHCNAGHLATSEYGTALAPIYAGLREGYGFRVYADETRPLLQGARLTACELQRAGVDVTLICDNMASLVMSQGRVQAVLVGCDRVAANGDAANKVGTSGLAVLSRHYGIPFYVLGPVSTIDMACPSGERIVIEERAPEEVTEMWYASRMAPRGVKVYNPAFDVTPHELITAIVTERGIARPPFDACFAEWFGR
ncbi:S-methyl-5-thioribose-1-phosphate isomerase [uncultured Alistipes sp.]|uniref:S-methyl-5-thioribose-1-phosphate isomerase n=1 Tax=uncultured Alistipes sp. TaxID=538949 RepID=UPI002613DE55|nr:S-methyl-5-thioribose-1-phosphate isomerase [uncultured Alistipes sp.]